ncbi:MAG: sigma-70 family RNA polymerase sigma factor [Methylovulum sp.]|nr:sigma-70 family RNA polymerase sigma factor [Methylovulum sp.]
MLTFSPFDAESLIEQHRQELVIFLFRRVSCRETANDLLQDLFLRLVSVKSSEPIHNHRAFLYRIAANVATDYLRRHQSDLLEWEDDKTLAAENVAASPEQHLLNMQELELCEQTLGKLSPLCQKIFMLSRFDGLTHQQIADELGISTSWVEKNIIKALKQCKQALKR